MTEDQQLKAIAHAIGTHHVEHDAQDPTGHAERKGILITDRNGKQSFDWHVEPMRGKWKDVGFEPIAPFTTCLNACAEMEKHVLRTDGDAYRYHLKALRGEEWGHATAAERCEAFILTKKLNQPKP